MVDFFLFFLRKRRQTAGKPSVFTPISDGFQMVNRKCSWEVRKTRQHWKSDHFNGLTATQDLAAAARRLVGNLS